MSLTVVMTGSTGAVGTSLRTEIVARGHRVVPIGRNTSPGWDLRQPLTPAVADALAGADVVVHAAADIRLGAPGAELAAANVDPVHRLVDLLATLAEPPRLVHVSSAFAEPQDGRDHNNAYERSKWQAEQIVRTAAPDASILRASLVTGRRRDGFIGRYSGIYIFLRMLRLGIIPAIPGYGDVRVDLVPVDVVARLGADLVDGRRQGIVQATSGPAAPTLAALVAAVYEVIEELVGEKIEAPRFVKPDVYHRLFRPIVEEELSAAQRVLLDTIEIFLPYFDHDHVFTSDSDLSDDEVMEAWKMSIRYWLGHGGSHTTARGKAIWATHS